jgi:gliding motility-associated-like protein
MLIYNRWGELVFKTETPEDRWDGNFNGAPADPGVYMYICEIRSTCLPDKEQFKRGAFNLLR